jgi:hypothetical protein
MAKNKNLVNDFVTIYSQMWYRDFPLQRSFSERAQRADWTTHVGVAVRSTADLMGLFTRFETGGRTDAVLRDNQDRAVALLEWEWTAIHRENEHINEFEKLRNNCLSESKNGNRVRFAAYLGYCRSETCNGEDYFALSASKLTAYTKCWVKNLPPLLLILVNFKWKGATKGGREFTSLTVDRIEGGRKTRLREQPAYPWNVHGSKWQYETKAAN